MSERLGYAADMSCSNIATNNLARCGAGNGTSCSNNCSNDGFESDFGCYFNERWLLHDDVAVRLRCPVIFRLRILSKSRPR